MAVLLNFLVQFLAWHKRVEPPTEGCKDAVPYSGTQSGVEQKLPEVHLCQSGRNGDEMANTWDESSGDCCRYTMTVEVSLGFLYLLLIQEAELAPFAVGKLIYYWTAEEISGEVVDGGTAVGTDGSHQNHHQDIHLSVGGVICSRGYHKFGRHWNDGAFKQHQKPDDRVGELIEK